MTSFAGARPRREEGAALVMALLFLTVCAVTIGALLTFANTSSSATNSLRAARGNEYDTQAAMDAAIATVRTGGTCGTVASGYTPTWTLNNPSRPLRVDCFPVSSSATQRNDVLSVCPTSVGATPCPDSASFLRANVIFYDTPGTGASLSVLTWSNQ